MAVLGNVAVNFIGRADKMLEASQKAAGGIDRVDKRLLKFQKGLGKAKKAFKGFAIAIAGAVGVGSFKALISSTNAMTEKLAAQVTTLREQAIFLNTSTRNLELLGEALEGDGLKAETLTKSMNRMLQSIQKATAQPEMLALFNELGYELKDLQAILDEGDTSEAFLKMANALTKVENEGAQAFLGQQLLGREWRQMSKVLAQYNGDIDQVAKTFSHLRFRTEEQDKAVKDFDQELRNVSRAHDSHRQYVLASNEEYRDALVAFTDLKEELTTTTYVGTIKAIGKVTEAYLGLKDGIVDLVDTYDDQVIKFFNDMKKHFDELDPKVIKIAKSIYFFRSSIYDLKKSAAEFLRGDARPEGFDQDITAGTGAKDTKKAKNDAKKAAMELAEAEGEGTKDGLEVSREAILKARDAYAKKLATQDPLKKLNEETIASIKATAEALKASSKDVTNIPLFEFVQEESKKYIQNINRLRDQAKAAEERLLNAGDDVKRKYRIEGEILAYKDALAQAEKQFESFSQIATEQYNKLFEASKGVQIQARSIAEQEFTGADATPYKDLQDQLAQANAEAMLIAENLFKSDTYIEAALENSRRQVETNQRIKEIKEEILDVQKQQNELDPEATARERADLILQIKELNAEKLELERINAESAEILAKEADTKAFGDRVAEMRGQVAGLKDTLASAGADFATSFITDIRSVGDAFKELGNIIKQEVIRQLVTIPIRNALGSFFGTAMAGGVKTGLTLVGEQGPEIVDFRTPSRVYTASQTQGMMGGGTTINFAPNIYGSNRAEMRQEMILGFQAFERELVKKVYGQMNRTVSPMRTTIRNA